MRTISFEEYLLMVDDELATKLTAKPSQKNEVDLSEIDD